VLRSLTSGQADLVTEPLVISGSEHPEIHAGFSAASLNPWVKLSGRVVGFDPTQGPFRVVIESHVTAPFETPVNPDGSFEFLTVLREHEYTASLLPVNDAASVAKVAVADKDVSGVQITVPREREITGHVKVEGDAPIPDFLLSLDGASSSMTATVQPDANST